MLKREGVRDNWVKKEGVEENCLQSEVVNGVKRDNLW